VSIFMPLPVLMRTLYGGLVTIKPTEASGSLFTLNMSLREKTTLKLCEFHGRGAFLVVVRHVIDPRADGIAPHQPSIAGPTSAN
jgi:hypothetical protein